MALADGKAYWNIHTDEFPGGEIRGFMTAAVPEIAPLPLMGLVALGVPAVSAWRSRRMKNNVAGFA
jgi:hypothetical protein